MSHGAGRDKNEGKKSGEAADTAMSRFGGSWDGQVRIAVPHPLRQQPIPVPCTFAQAFDARRMRDGRRPAHV